MSTTTGATFTMPAQQIYLAELRSHGQKDIAAEVAGVSRVIVEAFKKHSDDNGLFAASESLALSLRSQHIVKRLESEFIEGILEPLLGPDGKQMLVKIIDETRPEGYREVPGWKRKVESAARLRVLERHDPSYREHKEVDLNSKHGALITSPSLSLDEFSALANEVTKRQLNGS